MPGTQSMLFAGASIKSTSKASIVILLSQILLHFFEWGPEAQKLFHWPYLQHPTLSMLLR